MFPFQKSLVSAHSESNQTQLHASTSPWPKAGPGPLRGDLFGPGSDLSTDQGRRPRTLPSGGIWTWQKPRPSRSEDLRAPSSASMSRRCHDTHDDSCHAAMPRIGETPFGIRAMYFGDFVKLGDPRLFCMKRNLYEDWKFRACAKLHVMSSSEGPSP